jgi:tetratricopeptide (TPR) repeat protein
MRLKNWHCVALLFIAVMAAYFFSLSAGFNSVDDLKRVNWLDNAGALDVVRLFFPNGRSYYYRPLGTLTFLLDRDLWGSSPSFIHLENILIHFGSAVMVFLLTRRLAAISGVFSLVPALGAALLFAWHPLTTEAVCWVSGRYDLLACFFLLVTVWLLLPGLQKSDKGLAAWSMLPLLMACLAKEVAVFVLPGLLWLVLFSAGRKPFFAVLRERFAVLCFPLLAVAGYFMLRHVATARDSGVKTALKGVMAVADYDVFDKLRVALKVYGFYFKKLLLPWPLNFGIVQISDYYVISGLFLGLVLLWLLWRRDLLSSLGIMAFCVLSPALLVVFGKMAWTPLAERYLYSSVALTAPAVALWLTQIFMRTDAVNRRRLILACGMVLLLFYGTTVHRAWIWQDNERLFRDTAVKSPDFDPARAELASALLRKGKADDAEAVLQTMQQESRSASYIVDDLNLAQRLMSRGELDAARELLLPLLERNPKKRHEVLQHLLKLNSLALSKAEGESEKERLRQESLTWLEEQLRLRPDAFTHYRIGKMRLALGESDAAILSFQQALQRAPADAFYREAAQKMLHKLQER